MAETQKLFGSDLHHAAPPDGPPRVAVKLSKDMQTKANCQRSVIADIHEEAFPGASQNMRIEPLITSVTPETVNELVKRAASLDAHYAPVDFGTWYQVHFEPDDSEGNVTKNRTTFDVTNTTHVEKLVRRLHAHPAVESAFPLRAVPPPAGLDIDPLSILENYLSNTDARFAHLFPGGDGAGIGFVDMEQVWNLNHEDLKAANITLISGTNKAFYDHGTEVLGAVLMANNNIGGTGLAPKANARVISQYQPGGFNTPSAIIGAVAVMEYGDLLLLEAQELNPADSSGLWPVEIAEATFDAIRLATAVGIVVVEAAANGGNNLDDYKNLAGLQIFNRSSKDFRDSGAIMVGAATSKEPTTRLSISNYGSRIDLYSFGENVETSTTDDTGTFNSIYTPNFSGTSSASAIVSGLALIIRGISQDRFGKSSPQSRFGPVELRKHLGYDGTPTANPKSDLIGVQPNLHSVISEVFPGIRPFLFLRNQIGDIGGFPSIRNCLCPDIIIRQRPVADPQALFGLGSGNENIDSLSEEILPGQDSYIYFRLFNTGGSDAYDVQIILNAVPTATYIDQMSQFWHEIGSVTIPHVPRGKMTVAGPVNWLGRQPLTPGQSCTIAQINVATEFNPNSYVRSIFGIPGPSAQGSLTSHIFPFVIPGDRDFTRDMTIETFGSLPPASKVALQMPLNLAQQLKVDFTAKTDPNVVSVQLPVSIRHTLGSVQIKADQNATLTTFQCQMVIEVPPAAFEEPGGFEFAIRQLQLTADSEGRVVGELGRLTWRVGKPSVPSNTLDAKSEATKVPPSNGRTV